MSTGGKNLDVEEIEAQLRRFGLRMEPALGSFDLGDAVIDVATGELFDGQLPATAAWLATQWTLLNGSEIDDGDMPPFSETPLPLLEPAAVAVAAHRERLGIEGDNELQVGHLLASLLLFCEARGVSFDSAMTIAREIRAEDHASG